MATPWTNTVPQGISGTGDAVVYNFDAAQNFIPQFQQFQQNQLRNQQLRDQQMQRQAASFRENMLNASSGRLWAPEIGEMEQQHIRKGIQLRQQGIDPYNSFDPRALNYQQEQREIESYQNYRKSLESEFNKNIQQLRTADLGEYDPESISQLMNFPSTTSLRDAYTRGVSLPQLRKAFRPDEVLKGVKANTIPIDVTEGNIRRTGTELDRPGTERAIISTILSAPGGTEFMNRLTNGIRPADLRNIPSSVQENVDDIIQEYSGNPQLRDQFARDFGITGPDQEGFRQVANTIAQTRVQAKQNYDNWINSQIDRAASGLKLGVSEQPDFRMENQQMARERLALARQSSNRAQARLGNKESSDSGSAQAVGQDLVLPYGPSTAGGRSNFTARNYTPVGSAGGKNFAGSPAIDLNTGRPVPALEPSDKYSIVGLTEVPLLKLGQGQRTSNDIPSGSIVTDDFASKNPNNVEWRPMIHVKGEYDDYMVPVDRMPGDLTKTQKSLFNSFKGLVGNRNSNAQTPQSQQQKPKLTW